MTHIPEKAKSEIIKRKLAGWSWTAIATWMQEKYAFEAHRTTYQKWYDREVSLRDGLSRHEVEEIPTDFSPDAHAKLIKNIESKTIVFKKQKFELIIYKNLMKIPT